MVPRHEWHTLRSQEMLCTAPTVIKHCCPPAAPQCVPHQPPTLQPSYTFHSLIFTQAQTAPHAPSLKMPHLPSITPQSHPLCTPLSPFATHPCYTFTSHPNPVSPNHVHTPMPSSYPVLQHVHSPHAHPHSNVLAPKIHPHTHVHPGPEHTVHSPSSYTPSTRL